MLTLTWKCTFPFLYFEVKYREPRKYKKCCNILLNFVILLRLLEIFPFREFMLLYLMSDQFLVCLNVDMEQLCHLVPLSNIPGAFHSPCYCLTWSTQLSTAWPALVWCPLFGQSWWTSKPSDKAIPSAFIFFFAHGSNYHAQLPHNTSWWLHCGNNCHLPINYQWQCDCCHLEPCVFGSTQALLKKQENFPRHCPIMWMGL